MKFINACCMSGSWHRQRRPNEQMPENASFFVFSAYNRSTTTQEGIVCQIGRNIKYQLHKCCINNTLEGKGANHERIQWIL